MGQECGREGECSRQMVQSYLDSFAHGAPDLFVSCTATPKLSRVSSFAGLVTEPENNTGQTSRAWELQVSGERERERESLPYEDIARR